MPLSEQAIDQLEDLLFCDDLNEDTLDYFGLHGLVCSSIVGPVKLSTSEITSICISGEIPSDRQPDLEHLGNCIELIAHELEQALLEGSPYHLPYEEEDELYEEALQSWCAGFVEGLLAHEEKWFSSDEEVAAELLLPYMALSGLFDNEEFAPILSNKKLMNQLETVVGEQLTDVFLYYHSDKKGGQDS